VLTDHITTGQCWQITSQLVSVDRSHHNWSVLAADYWHRVRDGWTSKQTLEARPLDKIPNTQSAWWVKTISKRLMYHPG